MFDYSKLIGLMAEKKYTQKSMSLKLGISENAFTNKIKGRSYFSALEIATICNTLKISNDMIGHYFFIPEV